MKYLCVYSRLNDDYTTVTLELCTMVSMYWIVNWTCYKLFICVFKYEKIHIQKFQNEISFWYYADDLMKLNTHTHFDTCYISRRKLCILVQSTHKKMKLTRKNHTYIHTTYKWNGKSDWIQTIEKAPKFINRKNFTFISIRAREAKKNHWTGDKKNPFHTYTQYITYINIIHPFRIDDGFLLYKNANTQEPIWNACKWIQLKISWLKSIWIFPAVVRLWFH